MLCITAFHPDSIACDIEAVGFVPVMKNHRGIHDAWVGRLTAEPVAPGYADYSWKLLPYDDERVDHESRFGVIFALR